MTPVAPAPEGAPPPYLGVERSLCGRRWQERGGDARAGMALAQSMGVPELVGRLLVSRGVPLESAASFLAPRLRDLLFDPSLLLDMDRAVSRLVRAIREDETVAVFGDYDVDGATAAALLHRFFRAIGRRLRLYIPDRLTEGYGPNAPALLRLKAEGVSVVITVDCGMTSFAPLEAAASAGLDVIVVDHHAAEPRLPPAAAVVNPNRFDQSGVPGTLAAVGVAYLLVVALNRALRREGWYSRAARCEPDLLQWLDLVALGTVCDVVPLSGLNRALVAQGMKIMAQRRNPGLAALADAAGLSERPDSYHLGFVLGPRVNAGGRVGAADLGARLLSTDDPVEAAVIARRLEELNAERRAVERAVLEAAVARIEAGDGGEDGLIFAAGEGWHPGVIGIVAGRLRERYGRPACVVALAGGIGKGSGRGVPGVSLGDAVIAARQAGLLISGGGHAMAAGFTVEQSRLHDLGAFLAARLRVAGGAAPLVPTLDLDGILNPAAACGDLARTVQRLGPFGAGNAEPRFVVPAARVLRAEVAGTDHVRCILTGIDGGRLKAVAFRSAQSELGRALLAGGGAPLHLAGVLRADSWQGRDGAQLHIEDAAPALS